VHGGVAHSGSHLVAYGSINSSDTFSPGAVDLDAMQGNALNLSGWPYVAQEHPTLYHSGWWEPGGNSSAEELELTQCQKMTPIRIENFSFCID
jgi:hypothetical protein